MFKCRIKSNRIELSPLGRAVMAARRVLSAEEREKAMDERMRRMGMDVNPKAPHSPHIHCTHDQAP